MDPLSLDQVRMMDADRQRLAVAASAQEREATELAERQRTVAAAIERQLLLLS